jgi:hypothetical protein
MAALRLIRLTPLWKSGEFGQDAVIDSSHLGAFSEFAAANRSALENLLDLEIRSDVSRKPVQQLNAVLGLMGLRVVKIGTTRSHEQKTYRYGMDRTALRSMLKIKRDRERTSGWQFVCCQYGWELDGAGSSDDEEDDT